MSRIDTHAFGLWWKLAKGWFSTKFASINVDLTPVEDKLDEVKEAVENIDIDTSDLAKQGTNSSATLTATQAALIDGNDTAISVSKEVRSEVGTGSDTAAETGTLFAVVKWVKDKVKAIYNALTDSTNGLVAIKSEAAAAKQAAQAIIGYALQGTNSSATNTAIKSAVDSLSSVADAAEAYNTGKTELAANITAKGVTASASETLPQLAEKVTQIAQQPIIMNDGDVANMYAKQLYGSLTEPNYWNLYHVLNDLLNDGRLMNYGGILLAEYYKGYDSLALAGAGAGGAYVVSDMENGVFKMYTEDTTHVWNDDLNGKGNRWVAYCFADEYHDFQITDTNTSPRSIFIGRKVGTISCLADTRTAHVIVPDGNSLQCYNPNTYSTNWQQEIVVRNIKQQSTPFAYLANNKSLNSEKVYFEADELSNTLFYGTHYSASFNMVSIIVRCKNWNGGSICNSTVQNLKYIEISDANTGRVKLADYQSGYFTNVKELVLSNCEGIDVYYAPYLPSSILPSNCVVSIDYASNDKLKGISFTGNLGWKNIEDLRLQDGWCRPLVADKFQSLTEANMYAHILQRLKQDEPDCGDGVTITLGATNLAKLTSAESVQLLDDLTNIYGYTFA